MLQQYLPFTVLKLSVITVPHLGYIRVATVLTVYGIETFINNEWLDNEFTTKLQQYLPFTVLKRSTTPTSRCDSLARLQQYLPFTVLKHRRSFFMVFFISVATVLTVYGIETFSIFKSKRSSSVVLQQYLPFTVLKLKRYAS